MEKLVLLYAGAWGARRFLSAIVGGEASSEYDRSAVLPRGDSDVLLRVLGGAREVWRSANVSGDSGTLEREVSGLVGEGGDG